MKFESNILFSAAAHALFIAAALFLAGRDAADRVPARYVQVTLLGHEGEAKAAEAGGGKAIAKTVPVPAPDPAASSPEPASHRKIHRQARVKTLPAGRKSPVMEIVPVSGPMSKQQTAAPKAPAPRIHEEAPVRQEKASMPVMEHFDSLTESSGFEADITGYPGARPSGEIDRAGTVSASDALSSSPYLGGDKDGSSGYKATKAGRNGGFGVISEIRAAIERARRYPLFARERGIEGTVTAEFYISNAGLPKNVRIKTSSGFVILDSAAKETIIRAAPFPVVKGKIEVPITFRLKREE